MKAAISATTDAINRHSDFNNDIKITASPSSWLNVRMISTVCTFSAESVEVEGAIDLDISGGVLSLTWHLANRSGERVSFSHYPGLENYYVAAVETLLPTIVEEVEHDTRVEQAIQEVSQELQECKLMYDEMCEIAPRVVSFIRELEQN